MVAALGEHDVAGDYGRQSVVDLMGELCRVAPAEAKARVCAARDLGPRRELTGAPLAPIFARVAAAQHDGQISAAHARVIIGCVDKIPTHLAWEAAGPTEQFLVEHATRLDPRQLGIVATRLLATIDPDGAAPDEAEQQRRRDSTLTPARDGSWLCTGGSPTNTPPPRTPCSTRSAHRNLPRTDTPMTAPPANAATTPCSRCFSGCCAQAPSRTVAAPPPP